MQRNTTRQAIIFDCDDVLLDWQEGFRRWMGTLQGIHLDPAGPQSWDMDVWVGQPATPFVERFNASHTFGSLHPCAGAKSAVARFYAAGHDLHVITSCSDDPIVIRRREQNLDCVFCDVFSSITCLPLGGTKYSTLMRFPRGSAWIEDNYVHACDGWLIGHDTWMLRRNHNVAQEKDSLRAIKWVSTFDQILDAVLTPPVSTAA